MFSHVSSGIVAEVTLRVNRNIEMPARSRHGNTAFLGRISTIVLMKYVNISMKTCLAGATESTLTRVRAAMSR
jgi:hypothetical protein